MQALTGLQQESKQWGYVSSATNTKAITFPVAFSAIYTVVVAPYKSSGDTGGEWITSFSKTTLNVRYSYGSQTAGVTWIACGK